MADAIRIVDYFYTQVSNKPGEGAKALAALKGAGVNLLLFSGFPVGRRGQLDFVPVDTAAFKAVARANKWKVFGPKKGFFVQGTDRAGAAGEVLQKLADAKLNVTAVTALATGDRYGMIVWVEARNVKKAAAALGLR